MVATIKQKLEFLILTQGLKKTVKQFKELQLGLRKTFAGHNNKAIGHFNKEFKKLGISTGKVNVKLRKFKMEYLSILFAGQALTRVFGGALRSIFNTFSKAENNTSRLSKNTMGLSASWEFLKFSIFNALDQPGIINFISGLVNMINKTSDLINKYPDLGTAIIAAFGALAVTGTVFAIVGSFILFWDGIMTVLAARTGVATASSAVAFTDLKGTFKTLFGAGLLIGVFFDIMGEGRGVIPSLPKLAMWTGLSALGAKFLGVSTGWTVVLTIAVAFGKPAVEKAQDLIAFQDKFFPEGGGLQKAQVTFEEFIRGPLEKMGFKMEGLTGRTRALRKAYDLYSTQMDESVTPAVRDLNVETGQNLNDTTTLIEKLPTLVAEKERDAAASNLQAEAERNKASALRELADANRYLEETKEGLRNSSSSTGLT